LGGLTVLVTGAGGFLGSAVAAEARARGHIVRTLTRRSGGDIVCDLADGVSAAALAGIDRIIHCAAALQGDDATMQRDTVQATRNLAATANVPIVLAGSIAVYDGLAGPVIDETTPIESRPDLRDAYTRAKIVQESAARTEIPLRILRIGALWGPGHLWNAHLGVFAGPLFLRMGQGEIPLAHVTHAAAALVSASESTWQGIEVINVVDDDRPDAAHYLAALPQRPKLTMQIPFGLMDAVTRLLSPLGARLPGLLRRPVLHARMAPRRYSNARLHALGWQPSLSFDQGMRAAR
jgi:nucleoside-diphosphate-sugar epimerase